jgi:hypothetical protein
MIPDKGRLSREAVTKKAESQTISLTITPELRAHADGEAVKISLSLATVLKVEADGKTLKEDRESLDGSMPMPLWMFRGKEELEEFWKRVLRAFYETLPVHLMIAAGDHVQLVANFILAETHPEEIALKEYIDERAKYRARELKRILKLSVVGNFSAWTRTNLARSVRTAIISLRRERSKVTQEAVANKLKEAHGDIAPKSGEALGALLIRNELKWNELKNRQ